MYASISPYENGNGVNDNKQIVKTENTGNARNKIHKSWNVGQIGYPI